MKTWLLVLLIVAYAFATSWAAHGYWNTSPNMSGHAGDNALFLFDRLIWAIVVVAVARLISRRSR